MIAGAIIIIIIILPTEMEPINNHCKDFNVSGNKIINVAPPQHEQDATTKAYVDAINNNLQRMIWRVHSFSALSNRQEYIKVINSKENTLVSLAGICTLTTNWKLTHSEHAYSYTYMEHAWLESAACTNNMWLPTQNFKGKYITMEYKFPVVVRNWSLLLRFITYQQIIITFHWEVSANGTQWTVLNKGRPSINAPIKEKALNGNTHAMVFINLDTSAAHKYPFWRIVVDNGHIPATRDNDPWVNLLLMALE